MNKLKPVAMAVLTLLAFAVVGCARPQGQAPAKLTPDAAKQMAEQGRDLVHTGNYEEANKALEQVAQTEQADAKTFLFLGITRYQKKDYNGAIAAYDKAIALDPKMAEAYQGKANTLRDMKNLTEAEVWYRKAWAANPQFVDAYTELAAQLDIAGQLPRSIEVIQECVKNNPNAPDLHVLLGNYYKANGETEKARASYESALKLDPNSQNAKDALAALK